MQTYHSVATAQSGMYVPALAAAAGPAGWETDGICSRAKVAYNIALQRKVKGREVYTLGEATVAGWRQLLGQLEGVHIQN